MSKYRLLPAVIAAAVGTLALSTSAGATTAPQSPYSLGVSALLGKDGTTDVYATTTSSSTSVAAPGSYKELQLKSFDQDGVTLVYTKNFHDVAAPGGAADVQRNDLVRHQPLNVHALAQTDQSKSTQVLDTKAIVNLRPELELSHLQAPATVYVKDHFTVDAVLAETNGDTGATSTVQILNGATALDTIGSVSVDAGTSRGLAFDLSFNTPGTYNLTMQVSNVAPGEWDTLHNQLQFTVVVIEPYKTLEYWASYWKHHYSSNETSTYKVAYHSDSVAESFGASYFTTDNAIASQGVHVKLGADGGNQIDVTIPVQSYGSGFQGCDWVTRTCVSGNNWGYGTQIYLNHWAGGYSYSRSWCNFWSCSSWSTGSSYGTFIDANQSVSAWLDVVAGSGVHYGGSLTLPIRLVYDNSWDSNNYWGGWWYSYHAWGYNRVWYGYGSGTTTWS